jgi:hypothetical protein
MGKRFAADDAYTAHVSNSKIKSARFGDGLHMVAAAYRRDVSSTSIWCRPTHLIRPGLILHPEQQKAVQTP